MGAAKKTAIGAAVGSLVLGGVLVGLGQIGQADNIDKNLAFNENPGVSVNSVQKNDKKETAKAKATDPAKTEVKGDKVDNLRENAAKNADTFCNDSKLPSGKGKDDKGGTCVPTQLGEVAKNPVKVAMPDFPGVVAEDKAFEVKVKIEDKFGPLDLNAFTHDENNKAGDTFLEAPGELDNDGRPLLHAHFGITTLDGRQGLPKTNDYDAAFTGVQGVKGNLSVKVSGLKAGFYRADVYAGGPGHAPTPTAKATQVQGFASVYFEVK